MAGKVSRLSGICHDRYGITKLVGDDVELAGISGQSDFMGKIGKASLTNYSLHHRLHGSIFFLQKWKELFGSSIVAERPQAFGRTS